MDIKLQKLAEKFPKQAKMIEFLDSLFATNITVKTLENENHEVVKTILAFDMTINRYEFVYENNTKTLYKVDNDKRIKIDNYLSLIENN